VSSLKDVVGLAGATSLLKNEKVYSEYFRLTPEDNLRLANLCGQNNEHLLQVESRLNVSIDSRGAQFHVFGGENSTQQARVILQRLYRDAEDKVLSPRNVQLYLQESGLEMLLKEKNDGAGNNGADLDQAMVLKLRNKTIKARGSNQHHYLKKVAICDINFGIGPAGTGKTYLAVALAVKALEEGSVQRLILARPAVEAGERLGFLPGDLAQKIDPYLRPLYDALYEMLGFDQVEKLIERNIIEVAPLAFMRGRTLNEAFVILDEAQNTTREQMKMFLTRLGFGSKAIITGDMTQTDLPSKQSSGLHQVVDILKEVEGVSFTFFDKKDVVRHAMVKRVVEAYESHDLKHSDAAKK